MVCGQAIVFIASVFICEVASGRIATIRRKRGFDRLDAGFAGGFKKRGFDRLDSGFAGGFKRSFDRLDSGFTGGFKRGLSGLNAGYFGGLKQGLGGRYDRHGSSTKMGSLLTKFYPDCNCSPYSGKRVIKRHTSNYDASSKRVSNLWGGRVVARGGFDRLDSGFAGGLD